MRDQDTIRNTIREGYAQIAKTGQWSGVKEASSSGCCSGGGCCGPTTITPEDVARAVGYASADLTMLPPGANMGLSCGNPTALAQLREGEVVVDLGSGGGFDCFLAGPRVGASGRVIGVDMTPEMLSKARTNIAMYEEKSGLHNVEFRLGEIEHLPVADDSVDVVISNCVLNLATDKASVWREIARVLRPGGRVAVSDLALLKPLPESVRTDAEALVGCIAGAQVIDEIRDDAHASGLTDIELVAQRQYVESMVNAEDPLYIAIASELPEGETIADYVVSLEITAKSPGGSCCGSSCC